MTAYTQFQNYVAEINDLLNTINILNWDTSTQMPPGGAATRAHQVATLAKVTQERMMSAELGRLLDAVEKEIADVPADSYRARAVRQTREAFDFAQRIPPKLMGDIAAHKPVADAAWTAAKAANDFASYIPHLERMVSLQQQLAEAIGYQEHPYNALLLKYEPDMTVAKLQKLFSDLRASILPLLRRIVAAGERTAPFFDQDFPAEQQRAFGLELAQKFGYDLQRGRLDISAHPFEVSFTRNDVRITTRYNRRFLPTAIMGILHEAGHALYEQNIAPELTRTALTTDFLGQYAVGGVSFGAHESASRLWENQVGRSRTFWQNHYARLRECFPTQLANVSLEEFYRGINSVKPSYIRVEADEVTYNFHIMLRFEIEMRMLDGSVKIAELPELWNAKMQEYLGVTPPTLAQGVLQDIHWAWGSFGSYTTYTVGNVMASQCFAQARKAPGVDAALSQGNYAPLLQWLTQNIYQHGRAYGVNELLKRATGRELDTQDYLAYIHDKYSELYV